MYLWNGLSLFRPECDNIYIGSTFCESEWAGDIQILHEVVGNFQCFLNCQKDGVAMFATVFKTSQ